MDALTLLCKAPQLNALSPAIEDATLRKAPQLNAQGATQGAQQNGPAWMQATKWISNNDSGQLSGGTAFKLQTLNFVCFLRFVLLCLTCLVARFALPPQSFLEITISRVCHYSQSQGQRTSLKIRLHTIALDIFCL